MDERTALGVTHPTPLHPLAADKALRHRLLAQARRWFGHSGEAEELVQDVYLRTADGVLPVSISSREAWLATVLRHLCVDAWRRNGRYQAILGQMAGDGVPEPDPGVSEDLVDRGHGVEQALRKLVTALPPDDALVVMLYEIWGYTHAELSEITGVTEVASRQRLRRAMQRLRDSKTADMAAHAVDEKDVAGLLALARRALANHESSGLIATLRAASPQAVSARSDSAGRAGRAGRAAAACSPPLPRTSWFQVGNVMGLLVQVGDGPATLLPLCETNAEAA